MIHRYRIIVPYILIFFFVLCFFVVILHHIPSQIFIPASPLPAVVSPKHLSVQPVTKQTITIPILMYHYVEYVKDPKDTIRQSLAITPHIFEQQLKTLVDNGYTFYTMKDLAEEKELRSKAVVLTFDDGYRDFYTDVYPLLKKYNAKATVYVVSGLLEDPNYLTIDQLQMLARDSRIDIGAHTVHHPNLSTVSQEHMHAEIVDSKKDIEQRTGVSVVSFCYPYGSYTPDTVQIVQNSGFLTAAANVYHKQTTDAFRIERIRPGNKTQQDLLNKLTTEPTTFTLFK